MRKIFEAAGVEGSVQRSLVGFCSRLNGFGGHFNSVGDLLDGLFNGVAG